MNRLESSANFLEMYTSQLEKADANYSIEFNDEALHELATDLDSVYDACEDACEREASWNIVFCSNIKLPAFGWLQEAGSTREPILVLGFLHEETSTANAIKVDRREACKIDVADSSFRFCDRYNTYALHKLRSVINFNHGRALRLVESVDYIATITLSGATPRATNMSGEFVLEYVSNGTINLHEVHRMVEYATGRFKVRLALENGELVDRRLYRTAIQPGTDLCILQKQFQQDERVAAERRESERQEKAQRRGRDKLEEEHVINEATRLGYYGALCRLMELLSEEGVSVSIKSSFAALVQANGLVHPAKRTLLGK